MQETNIYQPRPLQRSGTSYGDKLFVTRQNDGALESTPPDPVRTPGLGDEAAAFDKPPLQRSHTSNYETELQNKKGKLQAERPHIGNTNSATNAYYLKQRRFSEEQKLGKAPKKDFFEDPSVDKLYLNDKDAETSKAVTDPDRVTGLLNHPPSFNDSDIQQGNNFEAEKSKPDDDFKDASSSAINDVNQLKRRLSWWSKD